MKTLTSRARAEAVIRGEKPDRVPAYTPTICSDVASRLLGRDVHTGGPPLWYAEAVARCQGETAWQEFDARVMEDLLALARKLDQDVIRFPWRLGVSSMSRLDENTFLSGDRDGVHQVWKWEPSVPNFIQVENTAPPLTTDDWPRLARENQASVEARSVQARETAGSREAKLQERVGDEFLVAGGGGGLSLGLDEVHLMAAVLEPGAVADMLDCDLAVGLAQLEGFARRGIQVILGGGDMADKNGTIYSPELFRDLMLPRWKKMAEQCRALGLHYVWRSDGNLWKVSDMLFRDAGFPGFGEVDFDAGMTLAKVRERYPDLVVWANVSGDRLRRGSVAEVTRHCREILAGSGGRGYVHGCSNTVLSGTPPENVWAMMKALDVRQEVRV